MAVTVSQQILTARFTSLGEYKTHYLKKKQQLYIAEH